MNVDLRKEWYSRDDVLSNIMPLLFHREVAFMVPYSLRQEKGNYPVRCVKAWHSSYLLNNMAAFDFFNRKYNLYHSIYLLDNMPMFSYAPLKRTEQQQAFFREYDNHVTSVDFVMDFDGDKELSLHERVENAREQTMKVCRILKEHNVPFCVMFSGSKGFHVEVRGFPPTREWSKQTREFERVAMRLVLLANGQRPYIPDSEDKQSDLREELKVRYSFDSSIYNVTRIWKVPYSYDVATDMICTPLSDEELISFNIEKYRVEHMLQQNHWKKGLKTRQGTIDHFWKMTGYLAIMEENF